jgi:hypothetical protein
MTEPTSTSKNPYIDEITDWNWDEIREEALQCIEENEMGDQEGRMFLGTVFHLMPSGKYYQPFACSNVEACEECKGDGCDHCGGIGSREAYLDSLYQEALEAVAEANGMFVTSGEGDPCDVFAGILVELSDD